MVLFDKVRPYCGINVGEVVGIDYMVTTQSAWFKGTDPKVISQAEAEDSA